MADQTSQTNTAIPQGTPPPVQMTRAQYQQTYGTVPSVPSAATAPAPIQMTRAQYQDQYGEAPQVPPSGASIVGNFVKTAPGLSGIFNPNSPINTAVREVPGQIVSDFKDAYTSLTTSQGGNRNESVPQAIGGGLDKYAKVMQALGSVFTRPVSAVLQPTIQNMADVITSNPNIVEGLNKVNDLIDAHPEISKDIGNAFNGILNQIGLQGGAEALKTTPVPTEKFTSPTIEPVRAPEASPTVTLKSGATTDAATAESLGKVSDEWRSPTTQNVAGFKIPSGILEESPDVPDFLAEQGLNPFEHIDDNGRYATADTAESLRQNAGAQSNNNMRAALRIADYSTEKTPVNDVISNANKYAANGQNVTADDLEAVEKNIAAKVSALERKYPEGMSLEQMHDERITYGKNGKFSPVGDKNVTNDARANRAIADSFAKQVTAKAPKELNYDSYNKYLSNFYKAADYLDSLNTKKAPVSLKTKLIRTTAKLGMAKLFSALPGGSIINEFIGYQVGKTLENLVENMTGSQRNTFLKELKVTDPATFTKVSDYLKKETATRAEYKSLPAPKEKGTPENPHIMSTSRLREDERQTSGEMIKNKYNYNPVDKKYYLKGERGGNEPKVSPNEETVTLYHASPNLPTDGNWRKGTFFADDEQSARYYAESHHRGDIKVKKVTIPKSLLIRGKNSPFVTLKEKYPVEGKKSK